MPKIYFHNIIFLLKNRVCGLCGNFNDDVSDDLTTKGNSLVSNVVVFGNSWKSMSCSDTVNQTSPCERNQYCLTWALRKCDIIQQSMFQSCHSEVCRLKESAIFAKGFKKKFQT